MSSVIQVQHINIKLLTLLLLNWFKQAVLFNLILLLRRLYSLGTLLGPYHASDLIRKKMTPISDTKSFIRTG